MIKENNNDDNKICLQNSTLFHGDCLDIMKNISDKSIDCILCDLPYGTTDCNWDSIIPFGILWEHYLRLIKDNGAIVLFGREPFTSKLICSNLYMYKHKWVWNKKQSGSFCNAKYMPLQIEEDIVCFSKGRVNYYPIMRKGKMRKKGGGSKKSETFTGLKNNNHFSYSDMYYPTNLLEFPNCCNKKDILHPTQKPVALLQYLIKTYTKQGETVLDNCMGSGSTGVACKGLDRNFIGIEKEKKYFDIAVERIKRECIKKKLF